MQMKWSGTDSGEKTFTFETDENGKAKIYFLEEQKKPQIPSFDLSNDIWLAVVEEGRGFSNRSPPRSK